MISELFKVFHLGVGVRGEAKASPQICDQLTFQVRRPQALKIQLCVYSDEYVCTQPYVGTEKKSLFYFIFLFYDLLMSGDVKPII